MGQKTDKTNKNRKITSKRPGPEKAGVGGSTPSRGTILSTTYIYPQPQLRSKTFQNPNFGLAGFPSPTAEKHGGDS